MIFCYNFNENNNTTLRDYSTNGREGTWTGSPSIVNGDDGLAVEFTDTGQYAQAGTGYMDGLSGVSLYFKIYVPSGSGTHTIFHSYPQLKLYLDLLNNTINATAQNDSNTSATVSLSIGTGMWHKVIVRFNGSDFLIYLDDFSTSDDVGLSGSLIAATQELTLGNKDDGSTGEQFTGKLEDVRAYHKALTSSEIKALFNFDTGLTVKSDSPHDFQVGDIITNQYDIKGVSSVVTLDIDDRTYKILPLEGPIIGGENWVRQGHCWDTLRQATLILREVSGEPEMEMLDGVSAPSHLNDDTKRVHSLRTDGAFIGFLKRSEWIPWINPNEGNVGDYSAHIVGNAQAQNDAYLTFLMPRTIGALESVEVYMLITAADQSLSLTFNVQHHALGNAYDSNQSTSTKSVTLSQDKSRAVDITSQCEGSSGQIHGVNVTNNNDPDLYLLGVKVDYKT